MLNPGVRFITNTYETFRPDMQKLICQKGQSTRQRVKTATLFQN